MQDLKKVTVRDILKLATKDLLAVYNANAPQPIDRFADHSAAFRRTKTLLESLGRGMNKKEVKMTEQPVENKKAKTKVLVAPIANAAATTEYHSVYAAFVALGLPVVKHQRFRRELKLSGKATFDQYIFTATY